MFVFDSIIVWIGFGPGLFSPTSSRTATSRPKTQQPSSMPDLNCILETKATSCFIQRIYGAAKPKMAIPEIWKFNQTIGCVKLLLLRLLPRLG